MVQSYEHIGIFITRHCIRPAWDGLVHTSAFAATESKNPHLRSEDKKLCLEIPAVTFFLKDTKCSIAFNQKFRDRGGKPAGLITTRTFLNMSKDMQLTVPMFNRCIALKLLKSSSTSLDSTSKKVLRRYIAVVLTLYRLQLNLPLIIIFNSLKLGLSVYFFLHSY